MAAILIGLIFAWVSGGVAGTDLPASAPPSPTPAGIRSILGPSCNYLGSSLLNDTISATSSVSQALGSTGAPGGPPSQSDKAALAKDIDSFYRFASCKRDLNGGLDTATRLTTLAFAFLGTIASAFNWRERGIIFGAVATAMVAFQSAFPFGEQARFYATIETRTYRIMSDARFRMNDDAAFEKIRQAFEDVKEDAADLVRTTPTPTPVPTGPSSQQTSAPAISQPEATPTPSP